LVLKRFETMVDEGVIMKKVKVDSESCIGCGACSKACPMSLLSMEDSSVVLSEVLDVYCIQCGHCASVCPASAIHVTEGSGASLSRTPAISYEDFTSLVFQRRSIRSYQEKTVDNSDLVKLVELTRWAPTARNIRVVHWSVVQKPEDVKKLAEMVIRWFERTGQFSGMVKAWSEGEDLVLRGAPHLIVAHAPKTALAPETDCVIALTTLELAAKAMGLGSCWAGFFRVACNGDPEIARAAAVPEGHEVYGAMMLGYPDRQLRYQSVPARPSAKVTWI
jgi:nitroreductase/Pyruvate/2-oxoacid:ferredoxin oxidoreductase delta subunit